MAHSPETEHKSIQTEIEETAEHGDEIGESNWLVSYADMMTLLVGFFVILQSFSKIDQEQFEAIKRFASLEFGGSYSIPFGDLVDRLRAELNKMGLGNQTVIKQSDDGIQISLRGTVFFDTGSVEIKPQAHLLLDKIVPIIKTQAKGMDIIIEGHTDDVPIGPDFDYKTNWELSGIRSCRVLDIFERYGFARRQLTAIGYGESRPVVANRDATGKPLQENRDQNRRVIIVLRKATESLVKAGAQGPTSPSD